MFIIYIYTHNIGRGIELTAKRDKPTLRPTLSRLPQPGLQNWAQLINNDNAITHNKQQNK